MVSNCVRQIRIKDTKIPLEAAAAGKKKRPLGVLVPVGAGLSPRGLKLCPANLHKR